MGRTTSPPAWALVFDTPQPYEPITRLQDRLVEARVADAIPDTVLLLQHRPVITLGRRGRTNHVVASPDELAARGVDVVTASRGGDVTYHAPGQWVIYPVIRLGGQGRDAHGYLHNLEEVAIRVCADAGVPAFRVEGKNGAWTEGGKIAAIGFHVRRGVTLHGMSFNVELDLAGFEAIVPCGLVGDPVCSLRSLRGEKSPAMSDVGNRLLHHVEEVLGRKLEHFTVDTAPDTLRERLSD